jgi:hypothetical protein
MLNLENSSFSKAGTPFDDPDSTNQAHHVLNMTMDKLYVAEHVPSSYSSSNDGSTQDPDGSPLTRWDVASLITYSGLEKQSFLLAMKTYDFLKNSPWDSVREHDNLFILEGHISLGVDLLSLLIPTMSKLGNKLEPLPPLCSMSSFTDKPHAANIDHYLVDHEIQDDKGIHSTDLREIYPTHRRKGSSQTDKSRPAECLISMTAFGVAIIVLRMISSYLVSNKYGVLRTRLQIDEASLTSVKSLNC